MIRGFMLCFGLGLCIITGNPVLSDTISGPCATEQSRWVTDNQSLQAAMEAYRQTKNESITPRIAQEMSTQGRGLSIARIVQVVLKKRNERCAEVARKCIELADIEKASFEEWRRCGSTGAQRRASTPTGDFKSTFRERDRLLAELQDLLMDEAHMQYKNYRAPAEPAPPSYEAHRPSDVGFR